MSLRLATSLVTLQRFDPSDVLRRHVDWWRSDRVDSGPIAGLELQRIADGMARKTAVETVDRESGDKTAGRQSTPHC